MDFWDLLTYGAWIVSAALLLYILVDTVLVGMRHSEEFLLSSREGEDRLLAETDADGAHRE